MCGIAGIICRKNFSAELYRESLNLALDKINHRGPDGRGIYIKNNIGLGHVRLSIIDLSDAGSQPMISNDENYVISYNGEVYNFKDLKNELMLKDSDYKSTTDTEIILEYFKRNGISSFNKLNGMFAFCLIDQVREKAYLVRDRFGIKPLYYSSNENNIVFASEMKAIKEISNINQMNEQVLPEWSYFGNALESRTIYKEVHQLLPGHYLEIDTSSLSVKKERYWSPESLNSKKVQSFKDVSKVVRKTQRLLEEAVCNQLVGDVEVGIFLSGGIDSSAITAFAAKNYGKPINTFSVGFDYESGKGELPKASIVAEKFNTNHNELRISGYDVADTIQKMVHHHDSPFSDAANIPLYLLGQEVKDKVKVVLQGDGGDEIFGGYRRYSTLARRSIWKPFINLISGIHKTFLPSNKGFYLRQRYLNALNSLDDAELMALLLTVEDKTSDPLKIFSKELRQRIQNVNPFEAYQNCNSRFITENLVQRMLLTDTQIILPNIFLEKVDRSTMASSIEVRVPFLDNTLTEFIISLPSRLKVKGGDKKWLLKKALEGLLPNEILHSKKTGFGVPYQMWLKGPLSDLFNDKVSDLKAKNCDLFDWKYIDTLKNEDYIGNRDHGFILWKLLNLMIWLSSK